MMNSSNESTYMINSEKYWNERFEKNWDAYSGSDQTRFFGEIMSMLMPEWLIRKIRLNQYRVCDMGCAFGEGANFLSQFLNVPVDGMDFSKEAIREATDRYPHLKFYHFDLTKDRLEQPYNVVYCSNVLEHFAAPWTLFKKLAKASSDYIIIQIPFRETLEIQEHFYKFDVDNIPVYIDKFHLIYANVIDGKKVEETMYPDNQILLVYSKHEEDLQVSYLSDMVLNLLNFEKTEVQQLQEENCVLENNVQSLKNEREKYAESNKELQAEVKALEDQTNSLSQELDSVKAIAESKIAYYEKQSKEYRIAQSDIEKYKAQISDREQQSQLRETALKNEISELRSRIQDAQNEVIRLSESKVYKFAHLLYRLKYQALAKTKEERKQFRRWITSKLKSRIGERDHRYNPLFRIMDKLNGERKVECLNGAATSTIASQQIENSLEEKRYFVPEFICEELNQKYDKFDVIVFSVIDYDFRYQRPQQIADHFAQKGHRVFYIDADFIAGDDLTITEKKENLYIVKLPNTIHPSVYSTNFTDDGVDINRILDKLLYQSGIRDALIIADYPTWINGMEYLKDIYGFPIITDYMDDFTGFDNAQDAFIEEACKRLLTVSDYVVASSQYLMDIAKQYNPKVEPIRNGTEFSHFHSAFRKEPTNKKRPVIGYYGAIAHWFAFDKVEYLAKNLPEVDVVLIGSVTETNHNLNKYPNIKFLGEKPYKDLPGYLKEFDVCLIPFDTSTNLIKATNPVKFYEYLSAGKKIVATEIPELMPFKDQYVYLANENEEFLDYVKLCLDEKDTLAKPEQCFEFAKLNDWSMRVAKFAETADSIFPKVSIVVLCYNQLDYTKECVDSILNNTAYPNYELILVDNNSTDDTANYLRNVNDKEDKVKIILNTTNRGFAGGNNDGIRAAEGDYIVLLNNDTVVTRGWLTNMVKRLEKDPKLGIVGPVTNSIGNEAKIEVQYNDISDMPAFAYWYTGNYMNQEYPNVNVLAMFCVMIRKTMMDEIGLLDENYGVGMFEDDDYSMAAKQAGYSIRLLEDVFIHHYGSVSFKKLEDEKYRNLFEKNKLYFENKWNTTWVMHQYRK